MATSIERQRSSQQLTAHLADDVRAFLKLNQLVALESRFLWARSVSSLFDVQPDHRCLSGVPIIIKQRCLNAIASEIKRAHSQYADTLKYDDDGAEILYEVSVDDDDGAENLYEVSMDDADVTDAIYSNQAMIKALQAQMAKDEKNQSSKSTEFLNLTNEDLYDGNESEDDLYSENPPPVPDRTYADAHAVRGGDYANLADDIRAASLQDAPNYTLLHQCASLLQQPVKSRRSTHNPQKQQKAPTETAPLRAASLSTATSNPNDGVPLRAASLSTATSNPNGGVTEQFITLHHGVDGYGVILAKNNGAVVLSGVKPNSPAARAGLKHGMQIVSISGLIAHEMSKSEMLEVISATRPSLVIGINQLHAVRRLSVIKNNSHPNTTNASASSLSTNTNTNTNTNINANTNNATTNTTDRRSLSANTNTNTNTNINANTNNATTKTTDRRRTLSSGDIEEMSVRLNLSSSDFAFYRGLWLDLLHSSTQTKANGKGVLSSDDAMKMFQRSGLNGPTLTKIVSISQQVNATKSNSPSNKPLAGQDVGQQQFLIICKFIAMAQQGDIPISVDYLRLKVRLPRFVDKDQEEVAI